MFTWGRMLPYLLLTLVVAVVYGPTLSYRFVWDDNIYIFGNQVYATADLHRIFTTLGNGVEYLPVRDLSHVLDFLLWGQRPAGFPLTNLVVYLLTLFLVYRFTVGLLGYLAIGQPGEDDPTRPVVALATALLFAVHPLHSEPVCFITCRNALLSTLFFFLAMHAYLRFLDASVQERRRWLWYLLALVGYLLALFAKATAITLPLVLAVLIFLGRDRRRPAAYLPLVPLLALSGTAYMLFTAIASRAHIIYWERGTGTLAIKAVTALQIIAFYLQKLAIPLGLSAEYDITISSAVNATALVTLAGLLPVLALALSWQRRHPWLPFALGWFLATLIPVLNFFPTYPQVADRYAFLPSYGFFLLLAATGGELARRRPCHRPLLGALLALALIWGGMTMAQNRIWRSDRALWEATIITAPRAVKAYINLGRICFVEGDYNRAFALFSTARNLYAPDPHYDFFSGFLAFVRRDYDEAARRFTSVLQRDPDFVEALFHMGIIYEQRGDRERAADHFRRAIRSWKSDMGTFKPQAAEHLRRLGYPDLEMEHRPTFSR